MKNRIFEGVEFCVDAEEMHRSEVLVLSAHTGFNTSGHLLRNELKSLNRLVADIESSKKGAYVVLCGTGNRHVVFYSSESGGFYQRHFPVCADKVWKDYFYSVTWTALQRAVERWKPKSIRLDCQMGYCVVELLAIQLEVIKHLREQDLLPVERVSLFGYGASTFDEAVKKVLKGNPTKVDSAAVDSVKECQSTVPGLEVAVYEVEVPLPASKG